MVTQAQERVAFRALTHAVIMSIFGDSPDVRSGRVTEAAVDSLDGGIVQKGMDMVMLGHRPDLGLRSLETSGFIKYLMPEVQGIVGFGGYEEGHKDLWDHTLRVVRQAPPRLEVRWAALFHDVGKPSCFRRKGGKVSFHGHEAASVRAFRQVAANTVLFPDRTFRDRVAAMIETLGNIESYQSDWTDSAVRRVRRRIEDDATWRDLLDLARADCTSAHADRRSRARARTDELESRVAELVKADEEAQRLKPPKGLGTYIQETEHVSGRELGLIMNRIKDGIVEGSIRPGLEFADYITWYRLQMP